MNMKTVLASFGVLTAAVCLLALPPVSAATCDRPRTGGHVVYKNDWTSDPGGFVRQGPTPYYNLYTGRPIGDGRPQYNHLTGNYQRPGEVFNLYTGRPLPPNPTYNPYTGGWGYNPGNAWGGNRPYGYGYNR
jgi:hypothetical protein